VQSIQRERMAEGANSLPSLREYTERWGVTPERVRPGQKVMHPGPMNRGVEIDPRVAAARGALSEALVLAGRSGEWGGRGRRWRRCGGALRPAPRRPCPVRGPRAAGGGLMLYGKN